MHLLWFVDLLGEGEGEIIFGQSEGFGAQNTYLGVARSMDRGDAVRGPLDRAMARYAVHTIPGTRNLFVPTWVHIKHYGLILGGPFFWCFSASSSFSENLEIT